MKTDQNRSLFLAVAVLILLMSLVLTHNGGLESLWAQVEPLSELTMGVQVAPSIELSISEGMNELGKKTFFSGNSIDFGSVSFTHPEKISNGDAFLENGTLKLEAVVNAGIIFSGATAVTLDLKKMKLSQNSFQNAYYSLSASRANTPSVIFQDPQSNRLASITNPTTIPLRMVLEISPQQSGYISDRFRLEARAL
jgi:hypothetical protein